MPRTLWILVATALIASPYAPRALSAPNGTAGPNSQQPDHDHLAPATKSNCSAEPLAYDPQLIKELVASAASEGSARRGLEVFRAAQFACLSCHEVGGVGGAVGPSLATIGATATPEQIAESLLWPNRQLKPEYVASVMVTSDGQAHQGYKRIEDDESITLFDLALQRELTLMKSDIEESRQIGSVMPGNLAASMSAVERRDLLRFLTELGHDPQLVESLRHTHEPANFPYTREPLRPDQWPNWQHHVNRDRWYDYYAKEAEFFRQQGSAPQLLPAFPGLDGGNLGHWGNQGDEGWDDDRWEHAELGTLLAGVFMGPNGPIPKGVCVRLGEVGQLSTCFNPQTLCYEALWHGDFLRISAVRHGFVDGLKPGGDLLPSPAGKPADGPFTYRGFYRLGKRVIFAYRLDGIEMLDSPWVEDGKFVRTVAPADQHPLRAALRGGPAQWPQEIRVRGELGAQHPYAIDTIPLPNDNPWKMPIFCGDHAFMSDDVALVCTMQGDVWRASGVDDKLVQITWRRVASGLHHALGMVVHEGAIYVLGRDQITRLHDLNNDGEADFYECFSNAMITSPAGHDYICGLARDNAGRFYTASTNQGLIRVAANGQQVDVVATGVRNCDGIHFSPDGSLTAPGSEGEWAPASMIYLVPAAALDAGEPPFFGHGGPIGPRPPALPLVYLPRGLDHSSGAQTTVPDHRWGPLAGQMIHTSYGGASHFLVLRDKVDGQVQGAVVPLPGEFRSGVHRASFHQRDGQLYVSGMAGWANYAMEDGCFQRVRYTGGRVQAPKSFHVHENGVLIRFTAEVDRQIAGDARRQFAQAWNYRYSVAYGSPEFSARHPGVVAHDALEISAVHTVDDHTMFVEIPELQPVNVLHLALSVDDGDPQQLFITVHKLDEPFTNVPNYRPTEKTIAAHPLLVDLASLREAEPNPWINSIPDARVIKISAGGNLTFAPNRLTATPGEALCVTFRNPDAVPHNWVLIKPGCLAAIGDLTNRMVAAPDSALRQYVPESEDVLVHTDIVGAGQSSSIYFHAPEHIGRYPFLCTFPGHWMVMNGELAVE